MCLLVKCELAECIGGLLTCVEEKQQDEGEDGGAVHLLVVCVVFC